MFQTKIKCDASCSILRYHHLRHATCPAFFYSGYLWTYLGLCGPWCGYNGVAYPLQTYSVDPATDCNYNVLPIGGPPAATASASSSESINATAIVSSLGAQGITTSAASLSSLAEHCSASSCSAGGPNRALTQDNSVLVNVDGNLAAWWAGQEANNLPVAPVTSFLPSVSVLSLDAAKYLYSEFRSTQIVQRSKSSVEC